MHIAFGCDNAASELKRELMELAQSLGHVCHDCGIGEGEANDYPLYAARAARMVQSGQCERGVVVCGTGVGMSLACNKMKGILFAFCAIDPKDRAVAEALIREQVAAIRNGEITTEEYEAAVKLLRNDLASYGDSQSQLLQYYFGQTFMEQIADPDEYARHIAEVSVEDIVKAAGRMTLDTVYFLTSEDEA